MPSALDWPFLFLGACLGHLVLMTRCHNWWYGLGLPRGTGKVIHLGHAALIFALPIALYAAWGWHLAGLFELSSAGLAQRATAAYVLVCALAGYVILPAVTLRHLLRHEPVVERHTEVIDVARELGYRPVGADRHRWLAYLPGNELFEVELSHRTLCPLRLPPAWDGLTILHLSDLHLKGMPDRKYFQFIMDRCAAWEPDLVAVTGDLADGWHHQRWIVPVLGRLRWRVAAFAILGNHDYWYDPPYIRRRLRRLGMVVPGSAWLQTEVRGEPLVVVGNEWPWGAPPPDLRDCPEGPFRLCLSHTPDNIAWARRAKIDLMLSGHVHGGQVRVPVFGSILVPSRFGRRYDAGTFDEDPTLLHVSRGLSGEHQLRFGCRPEVTLLTLRARQEEG
jgi:predicted MPP superfamily phosphohydrolase